MKPRLLERQRPATRQARKSWCSCGKTRESKSVLCSWAVSLVVAGAARFGERVRSVSTSFRVVGRLFRGSGRAESHSRLRWRVLSCLLRIPRGGDRQRPQRASRWSLLRRRRRWNGNCNDCHYCRSQWTLTCSFNSFGCTQRGSKSKCSSVVGCCGPKRCSLFCGDVKCCRRSESREVCD